MELLINWLCLFRFSPNSRNQIERYYNTLLTTPVALLAQLPLYFYPDCSYSIYATGAYVFAAYDPLKALHLSNITGVMMLDNVILARWDPLRFKGWVAFAGTENAFVANTASMRWGGIGAPISPLSNPSLASAYAYTDINVDRAAQNNFGTTNNKRIYLLIHSLLP